MANGAGTVTVKVSAGATATARFSQVASAACRIPTVILFDTARSFIAPDQKLAIHQAFDHGLTRGSGNGPVPAPNRFLLIVGHTDLVGSGSTNQALSERRALAALAVFTVTADDWETLFETETWGTHEIETMSAQVDPGGTSDLIAHYLADKAARLDLIQRYLVFLRPASVPSVSPAVQPATVKLPPLTRPVIGCGLRHPRVKSPGAERENRRIEFFYFSVPDPGVRDCSAYPTWKVVCGPFMTVGIELQDEYGDPYVGPFDLTLPTGGVLSSERTDAKGTWTRDGLPAGTYTVTVSGKSISLFP
jgi:hypothetical protein